MLCDDIQYIHVQNIRLSLHFDLTDWLKLLDALGGPYELLACIVYWIFYLCEKNGKSFLSLKAFLVCENQIV